MADFSAFAGRPVPDWYARPQLGIFIHWGMAAIPAFAPAGRSISDLFVSDYDRAFVMGPYAEWYDNALRDPESPTRAYHRERWGDAPYAAFREPFEAAAEAFDADAWADLFKAAGAEYVVFVTKHHDGFCLWPTGIDNPNRPGWHSKRDFVGELGEAVRARGMRYGLYYSGGLDWTFRPSLIRNMGEMFACVPTDATYSAYALAQARELIDRYRPSVLWNDIAWPNVEDLPGLFAHYYATVPDGVINDRWMASAPLFESLRDPANCASFNAMVKARIAEVGVHGGSTSTPPHCDFRTVEYTTGDHMVGKGKWESTRGLGLAFGYNAAEATDDYMTGPQLLELYREVTGGGGNFDLTGKVAVITGSLARHRSAIAERMAEHGAKVVISSRKKDPCDEVAAAINAHGDGHGHRRSGQHLRKDDLQPWSTRRCAPSAASTCWSATPPATPTTARWPASATRQFRKILDNNIVSATTG
jgi:alpha-L-fucosidase